MIEVRPWLYIGNSQHAMRAGEEDAFESVVTLSQYEIETVSPYSEENKAYYVPLIDGGDNTQENFDKAVDTVLRAVEKHGEVLVHCSAGISRSASVVATVLACKEDLSFDDALAQVRKVKPNVNPHPALERQAYAYLEEEHPFQKYENS